MIDLHIVVPSPTKDPVQHLEVEVLCAYLRQAGFEVSLTDSALLQGGLEALIQELPNQTSRILYWHLQSKRQLFGLEALYGDDDIARRVGAGRDLVVVGGYYATHLAREILARWPRLTAAIVGAPEQPLEYLLRSLTDLTEGNGNAWRMSPGLLLRRGGRTFSQNSPPAPVLQLTRLPAAVDDLFHESRREQGQRVLFSRGCDSFCGYCGFGPYFQKTLPKQRSHWQARPAGDVAAEIETVQAKHGVNFFVFDAAVFFGYDERGSAAVEELCREILRRKLEIRFKLVSHPGHLVRNADLLPLLRRAGLELVYLGLDSGSQAALNRFQVTFDAASGLDALRLLQIHDIGITPGFIFYEPYMTPDDVASQVRFLRAAKPYFSHLKPTYGYYLDRFLLPKSLEVKPFMPMCEDLRRDGLLVSSADPFGPLQARFRDPAVAELRRAHRRVHREVFVALRPIFWNRGCAEAYPDLETLPLDVLDALREGVESGTVKAESATATAIDLINATLGSDLPEIFEAGSLSTRRRRRVSRLLNLESSSRQDPRHR